MLHLLPQMIFALVLLASTILFARRIRFIRRNILLGRDVDLTDRPRERWMTMARVALGQGKMVARPLAGILHIIVYAGFLIINLEMLEIVVDGLLGTHRIFSGLGGLYDLLIGSFEVLAAAVFLACAVFLVRRNGGRIARFRSAEMTTWPKGDANIILLTECALMFAFLSMNAADSIAQSRVLDHYTLVGTFPVSQFLVPLYEGLSNAGVIAVERGMWWFHIVGVLSFLVYVTYSKHLHILFAFPNTYYSNLRPQAALDNMIAVKKEVDLMMDPTADPYATPPAVAASEAGGKAGSHPEMPARFGVKDAMDLTWKQLLEAYTCTECGRCTSECPANLTGKKLSPRKIMMDTRDRIEEIGANCDKNGGTFVDDGKSLLGGNFISEEELWACTSCQACVQACPINISPMGIILDMRRNLIMEESRSPEPITTMFNNIENNGAPWAMSASDRGAWTSES